jgi:hypothetical protein
MPHHGIGFDPATHSFQPTPMRYPLAAVVGLLSIAFSAPLSAQTITPSTPPVGDAAAIPMPRWQVGVSAEAGQPIGAFKQHVKNAAGGQGYALLRLDREGRFSLRAQGGWLNYGHESQRTCLGTAPNCRVAVNQTTANGILSLALGPQVTLPLGPVRTYGYGLVGMSRFATVSGMGGGLVPDLVAGDENFGDSGAMWRGGVGLALPVTRHTSIDVGVDFENHGRRDYLLKGGLTDKPDGSLGFDVTRSKASLYAIRFGITRALGRKTAQATPTR